MYKRQIETRVSVSTGTLFVPSTGSVTFVENDGVNDTAFSIRGTAAEITAVLEGMIYSPPLNFSGIVELSIASGLPGTAPSSPERTVDRLFIQVHGQVTATTEVDVPTDTSNTETFYNINRGSQNAVGLFPDGRYVVVWSANGAPEAAGDFDVFARIMNADGTESVAPFVVNETSTIVTEQGNQRGASVAVNDDGTFVVVYTTDDSGSENVVVRRFDSSGVPLTAEIPAHAPSGDIQNNAAIAMNHLGEFVVVWEDSVQGIVMQRFDSSAGTVGGPILVVANTATRDPSVAIDALGRIFLIWGHDSTGGIQARVWNPETSSFFGLLQLSNTNASGGAVVAVNDAGEGVFAWHEDGDGTGSWDIFERRIDPNGTIFAQTQVNTDTTNNGHFVPSVAVDVAGNYAITWAGRTTGDNFGLTVRQYNADGIPITDSEHCLLYTSPSPRD